MKAGFVGLVGLPNAGKSTLVNALMDAKIGAVTRKAQTTRKRILGIWNDSDSQIIWVDAPGMVSARAGLNAYLGQEFESTLQESDVLVAVLNLDCKDPKKLDEIIDRVAKSRKPWFAVITKDDLAFPNRNMILREKVRALGAQCVAVSAKRKSDVMKELVLPLAKSLLPESPAPLYPTDILTTQTEREILEEIVREKCFEYLHQEIPYGLAVQCMKFEERDEDSVLAEVDVVVSRDTHISMVVGKSAQLIKRIGTEARLDAETILGRKIILKTHVKASENWMSKPHKLQELGYAQRTK